MALMETHYGSNDWEEDQELLAVVVTKNGLKEAGVIEFRENLFTGTDSEMPRLSSPKEDKNLISCNRANLLFMCEKAFMSISVACVL